ncbi:MAG: PAC2 family protein [Deltaproteobacteria bacterium]|nr:PAC2 family protein [Deltaproteobacteria bacterium]
MEADIKALHWRHEPKLKKPIMIAAFEGWNDGSRAATNALQRLVRDFEAQKFAELDPEHFYVFSENRPTVRWIDGFTRHLDWQTNVFYEAKLPGTNQDVVLFHGTEPNLLWRNYCSNLTEVAKRLGVGMVITLGAYLADVLYTLPVQVNGFSSDPALMEKHELKRSSYEGPTGIVGVLTNHSQVLGHTTLSLWAAVPYYISIPNPKAVQALITQLKNIFGFEYNMSVLEKEADVFDNEINDVVARDPNVAAYVRELKKREFLN